MRSSRVLPLALQLGKAVKAEVPASGRFVHTQPRQVNNGKKFAQIAWTGALVGGGVATWYNWEKIQNFVSRNVIESKHLLALNAATKANGTPQPNTFSQTKQHALYLWIHLSPTADAAKCAKTMVDLQKMVDKVTPPDMRDETDEVLAGVGFGEDFYKKVAPKGAPSSYYYVHRRGTLGEMPNTGGDIFIHAKSDTPSKLFELAQMVQRTLPKGSIDRFTDVYSFVYQNGRDLSGFIDGTENAADEDTRFQVAVNKNTGGSFCITQRWIHDLSMFNDTKDSVLEGIVGRARSDSTELKKKLATSHVARMTSGPAFGAPKPVQIVRQSMPYGTVGGESGLFFIAFAESPKNFDYMLDRMVGATEDKLSDEVMRFGRCVAGNYWYFPSAEELKLMA
jgi:Dyp-type peroxidase family